MSEDLVDPAAAAESKAIQFVQIAVMAAEGVAVLAAARAEARAARTEAGAADLLSSVEAARVPAERLWQPALDATQRDKLTEPQALTAWSAAQPWRDVDPAARKASDGALERLRALNPAAIDHYDVLRSKGIAPAHAMRAAAPVLTGATVLSTASVARGGVVHNAADAVAASYPARLTAPAATPAGALGTAAPKSRQLPTATKRYAARSGR